MSSLHSTPEPGGEDGLASRISDHFAAFRPGGAKGDAEMKLVDELVRIRDLIVVVDLAVLGTHGNQIETTAIDAVAMLAIDRLSAAIDGLTAKEGRA